MTGEPVGVTANQAATGNGIEKVYSPTLTGPFGGLVGNLFLLNVGAYRDALSQLGGDQFAGLVQGLRNQSLQINNKLSDQLDCTVAANGMDNCDARDGQFRIWGQALFNDVSVDSGINARAMRRTTGPRCWGPITPPAGSRSAGLSAIATRSWISPATPAGSKPMAGNSD